MKKILVILFLIVFLGFNFTLADELRRGMAESGDDGQESSNYPYSVNISFTYIELMYQLDRWGGATRFPNVTIPQGATINSAYIWQWSYSSAWKHAYDSIACEDVDSATIILVENANISNRWNSRTTAWVLWQETMQTYQPDSTPAVTTLLQEIVNRPGWKSGNAVIFLYRNCYEAGVDSAQHEFFSWDYDVYGSGVYAGSLHVDYTEQEAGIKRIMWKK